MRISDLPEDMQTLLYQFSDDTGWTLSHPAYRDPNRFGTIELHELEIQVSKLPRISLPASDRASWSDADITETPPIVIAHGYLVDGRHRVWLARKRNARSIAAVDASPIIIRSRMDRPIGRISRNPAPMTLTDFGRRVRKLINSSRIFSLLPFGDWGAGGCWVLARALVEHLGHGARLVAISEEWTDRNGKRVYLPVSHIAVEFLDMYIDYLGAQGEDEFLTNLAANGMRNPKIHPMTPALERKAASCGIDNDYYTGVGESVKDILAREFNQAFAL